LRYGDRDGGSNESGERRSFIATTGHERAGASILAVCAGSSFAGCILMIDPFGMRGPPFTRTVTLVGWNMAMGIFVYRGLHLMLGLVASFKAMPGRRRAADCGI